MLVKATREGYYGNRVRKPGQTFNYTPMTETQQKAYKKKHGVKEDYFPSWMEKVNVDKNADPLKSRNDKLQSLSDAVDAAKQALTDAEAAAHAADDKFNAATKKADKELAADEATTANEAVDNATQVLLDAEAALATAESE